MKKTYQKKALHYLRQGLLASFLVFISTTPLVFAAETTPDKGNPGLIAPKVNADIVKSPSPFQPIVPELNVKIPGLQFSSSLGMDREHRIVVPYLAQYIAAVYKYLVGASVIAAAIMVTYGGFLYITSSSGATAADGKEYIKDALLGLCLVLGATTILYTITGRGEGQLQPLTVQVVDKELLEVIPANPNEFWKAARNVPPGSGAPSTPENNNFPPDPNSPPPDAPSGNTFTDGECTFELNRLKLPTKFSVYQCGLKLAKKHDLNPCWVVVGFNWESKDGLPAVGYDELAPNTSQQTIKGICSSPKDGSKSCGPKQNNDYLNLDGSKPDLGLDWRYSRGLGMLQTTIFPKSKNNNALVGQTAYWCNPDVPSIMLPPKGGTCYTAKDLMSPTKGIEAGIIILKSKVGAGGGDPYKVWEAWGGQISHPCPETDSRCKMNDAIYTGRAKEVKSCLDATSGGGAVLAGFMRGATRCRGDAPPSLKACQAENQRILERNKTLPPDQQQPTYSCNSGCNPGMRYPVSGDQLTP